MATNTTTRHIPVSLSTSNERQIPVVPFNHLHRNLMGNLADAGVPVKFGDNIFSILVKDQISQLLDLPRIKSLRHTEENAARTVTYEITEIVKQIVARHVKENYKVIIQVMCYPKQQEKNILIMSRSLWNYRTDDVLSVEIETDAFKYLIIIHGVVA